MGNANGREEGGGADDHHHHPSGRSNGELGARGGYAHRSSESMANGSPPASPSRSASPILFSSQVSILVYLFVRSLVGLFFRLFSCFPFLFCLFVCSVLCFSKGTLLMPIWFNSIRFLQSLFDISVCHYIVVYIYHDTTTRFKTLTELAGFGLVYFGLDQYRFDMINTISKPLDVLCLGWPEWLIWTWMICVIKVFIC